MLSTCVSGGGGESHGHLVQLKKSKKSSYHKFLTNFVIINLSLDQDRIGTQQKAGFGEKYENCFVQL